MSDRTHWTAGLIAALASALIVAPADATFPGKNGRIAFESFELLGEELPPLRERHSIDAARFSGGGRVTLRGCSTVGGLPPQRSDCSIEYHSPAWSPDGRRVAFDAGDRIGVMGSDGGGFRLLEPASGDDGDPAWSPDGRRLVVTGTTASSTTDLYVVELASGDARRLTRAGGRTPDWSSRNRIAFVRGARPFGPSGVVPKGDLYTVRPSGKGLRQLTRGGAWDPSWSPGGSRIAFTRGRPGRFDVYSIRTNGTGLRRVRTPGSHPERAVWSPDGRWIAYQVFDGAIYARRLSDGREREVAESGQSSQGSFGAFEPAWQPLRALRN